MRSHRRAAPRAALITGASSGIGAAFARCLAPSSGLVLVARNRDRLEALRAELPQDDVEIVSADLTTPEGCDTAAAAADTAGIDLLVSNAGMGRIGAVLDSDPKDLEATVQLNALAPLRLIRAMLPGMLERAAASDRRAGLIDITSTAAFVSVPGFATYAASKAFLQSLSESLAAELRGEPIDVLTLAPGPTKSDFGRRAGYGGGSLPAAASPDTVARVALRSLGQTPTLALGAEGAVFNPLTFGRQGFAHLLDLGRRVLR